MSGLQAGPAGVREGGPGRLGPRRVPTVDVHLVHSYACPLGGGGGRGGPTP